MGDYHSSHHRTHDRTSSSRSGSPFLANNRLASGHTDETTAFACPPRSATPSTRTTTADQASLLNVILPTFLQSEQQLSTNGGGTPMATLAAANRSPALSPRTQSSPARSQSRRPSYVAEAETTAATVVSWGRLGAECPSLAAFDVICMRAHGVEITSQKTISSIPTFNLKKR